MPVRSSRLFLPLLLAFTGCGRIADLDEITSPDALSFCSDASGAAAKVLVHRERRDEHTVTLRIERLDAAGNVLTFLTDEGDDGSFEKRVDAEWEYDSEGRWIEQRRDRDGDGVVDVVNVREFDARGEIVWEADDDDNDGDWDHTTTRTFDEDGRRTSVVWDDDGDGEADTLLSVSYDENGGSVSSYDDGANGTIERTSSTTYLGEGVWVDEQDGDGDGIADVRNRLVVDDEGRVVESATD